MMLLRPHQWIKNLLLFFPPFFGGLIVSSEVFAKTFPALMVFCTAASASYIINDIIDIEADRKHNSKRLRAIAAGDISVSTGLVIAAVLLAIAFSVSFLVSPLFWLYVISYLLVSFSYTFFFKNVVILDIFAISLGFLLRVMAGGEAFGVAVSNWLFMAVFLVSLCLAAGKRMGELVLMEEEAQNHRKSLAGYSISFLEGILWFSASAALITYSLYTLEQNSGLLYTVPLAAFGLLRYIYISRNGNGDPTEALLKDPQIMITGIIWAISIGFVIYW